MALTDPEATPARERVRCTHCGEVIGVYEPVIHVVGGRPEKTSRAAEPSLSTGSAGPIYHLLCYEPPRRRHP